MLICLSISGQTSFAISNTPGSAIIKASGLISFVNNDDRDKFQAEYLELMNVDVELAAAPIIISESDANDFKISPAEIASLEGLIDFE